MILDVWNRDPLWHVWSTSQMRRLSLLHELAINPIIYAEVSVSFANSTALDEKLADLGIILVSVPRAAAFLAGKGYLLYRRQNGTRSNVLSDFFIGAHAAVLGCPLLTRDTRRYSTYFPNVHLIAP